MTKEEKEINDSGQPSFRSYVRVHVCLSGFTTHLVLFSNYRIKVFQKEDN